MSDRTLRACRAETPLGAVRIEADDTGVVSLRFSDEAAPDAADGILGDAAVQLFEYFSHARTAFTVPLSPRGTDFQKKVWRALREIPYGETRSYAGIAQAIGSPKAARAVGSACHNNPILILIPCHRVVGKNGALTGFAAGLDVKRALLELESE